MHFYNSNINNENNRKETFNRPETNPTNINSDEIYKRRTTEHPESSSYFYDYSNFDSTTKRFLPSQISNIYSSNNSEESTSRRNPQPDSINSQSNFYTFGK